MHHRYDWSRIVPVGEWTADEAEAFARRVEEIADEEAARKKAQPTEPQEAS